MSTKSLSQATFAGGCFWCMVKPFTDYPGIVGIVSGYMGGSQKTATYEQVKTGTTGHTEAVQITFDDTLFSYEQLLEIYWPQVDPTDDEGQFQDRGSNYRAMIFYHNEEQKSLAEKSKEQLIQSNRFKKPIITPIVKAMTFFPAEDDHQDFYKKNPQHYKEDLEQSGRKEFISTNWQ
ncbi:peptide-methionine (S)-S-oxide reductase MsrA [Kurthia sibirica]|uniref:Peptide methionine sulfoxide reductase MsrA n=1 Tax=Kurthia sibirica TaxID=202750 RepID=A0A2U3AJ73_9BACL|nr:peptide-methionine (S)-S-oxide reductase MsrA [Kurthia sibirica]PWI24521.1 peptide-methionine (S)-S-oxide reductase [Kurthia sibirica]GEK33590.1 peptide methionine sulfoxide reductase MsrA [Kurthia sibirica]